MKKVVAVILAIVVLLVCTVALADSAHLDLSKAHFVKMGSYYAFSIPNDNLILFRVVDGRDDASFTTQYVNGYLTATIYSYSGHRTLTCYFMEISTGVMYS